MHMDHGEKKGCQQATEGKKKQKSKANNLVEKAKKELAWSPQKTKKPSVNILGMFTFSNFLFYFRNVRHLQLFVLF